jgi:glycosyltransferase involved in cell wall biosynthesis
MPEKNKLKIGLDLINLPTLFSGSGRYVSQLINGLAEIDKENEYILFLNKNIANQLSFENPRFQKIVLNLSYLKILPLNQLYFFFRSIFSRLKLDILHSPISLSPLFLFNSLKRVVTIHDLAFKFFPQNFSQLELIWANFAQPICFKKVEKIVAVSETTKKDILKFYNVSEEKITVIHHCVSLKLPKVSDKELLAIRVRYNLPERYLLHVGIPYKRKNLNLLLKAFQILKRKGIPHKLVLVGFSDKAIKDTENVFLLLEKINIKKDDVILIGFVPETDLPLIYKMADLFVFPSLYEGFGYPPLEAMACGTPVVVSNTSSLPEIVGDAGLYFNPLDPQDIAEKIFQVLSSPSLAEKLKNLGLKRMQQFSMEKMIQKYLEVYREVAK